MENKLVIGLLLLPFLVITVSLPVLVLILFQLMRATLPGTSFDFDFLFFLQYLPDFDIEGFIAGAYTVCGSSYPVFLMAIVGLLKTLGALMGLKKVVLCWWFWSRTERASKRGFKRPLLGPPLKKPLPGWQGRWTSLGMLVGRLAPPVTWQFTPEEVLDPNKLAHCLREGCLAYSDPNHQLLAFYWGLAHAYQAAVEHCHKVTGEDTGTQIVEDTTDTPNQTGTQINRQKTVIAPVVKRRSWIGTSEEATVGEGAGEGTSASFSTNDIGAGPSTEEAKQSPGKQERQREVKQEAIISRSLTPAELRDIQKEYRRLPGERVLTWLLRCRNGGAESYMLNGQETQHLSTIARNDKIKKKMAKAQGDCNLLLRLFGGVTGAYPYRESLKSSPRKWTTIDEASQYLRELALLELLYGDPLERIATTDPEYVPCTVPMWRKVMQGCPPSLVSCLLTVFPQNGDQVPRTVNDMWSWLKTIKEGLDAFRADLPDSRDHSRSRDRQVTERRVPSEDSDKDETEERPQSWSRSRSHSRSRPRPRSPRTAHGKKENPKSKPCSERG